MPIKEFQNLIEDLEDLAVVAKRGDESALRQLRNIPKQYIPKIIKEVESLRSKSISARKQEIIRL